MGLLGIALVSDACGYGTCKIYCSSWCLTSSNILKPEEGSSGPCWWRGSSVDGREGLPSCCQLQDQAKSSWMVGTRTMTFGSAPASSLSCAVLPASLFLQVIHTLNLGIRDPSPLPIAVQELNILLTFCSCPITSGYIWHICVTWPGCFSYACSPWLLGFHPRCQHCSLQDA